MRQFMDRTAREAAAITDDDIRAYFLYLREDKKLAPSTINIALHALRFFFIHTMQRDWGVFDILRAGSSARRIMASASCGLRQPVASLRAVTADRGPRRSARRPPPASRRGSSRGGDRRRLR